MFFHNFIKTISEVREYDNDNYMFTEYLITVPDSEDISAVLEYLYTYFHNIEGALDKAFDMIVSYVRNLEVDDNSVRFTVEHKSLNGLIAAGSFLV